MATRRAAKSVPLTDEQFHAIARVLADPRRFAILQQIAAKPELPCSALTAHKVISPATISHHLKELGEAGLITLERNGRTANLSLCRPIWKAYLQRLAAL